MRHTNNIKNIRNVQIFGIGLHGIGSILNILPPHRHYDFMKGSNIILNDNLALQSDFINVGNDLKIGIESFKGQHHEQIRSVG